MGQTNTPLSFLLLTTPALAALLSHRSYSDNLQQDLKRIDRVYYSTNIFETHENDFLCSVCGEGSELSDRQIFPQNLKTSLTRAKFKCLGVASLPHTCLSTWYDGDTGISRINHVMLYSFSTFCHLAFLFSLLCVCVWEIVWLAVTTDSTHSKRCLKGATQNPMSFCTQRCGISVLIKKLRRRTKDIKQETSRNKSGNKEKDGVFWHPHHWVTNTFLKGRPDAYSSSLQSRRYKQWSVKILCQSNKNKWQDTEDMEKILWQPLSRNVFFSGFEKPYRLYYEFDCILLCINKK